jgi:hypothetical protein
MTSVSGGSVGTFMYKIVGSSNTLFLSAAGKLLATLMLFYNRDETQQDNG